MSGLRFVVTADNSGFLQSMESTRYGLRQTADVARQSGVTISGAMSGLEKQMIGLALKAGGLFSGAKALQFARECVNVRSEVESLEISFGILLQSEEKAGKLIKEIRQFASTTPMDMNTLAQGAQTMLAFNIEGEKIMPLLKAIGDVSMGNADKFTSLSLAFSQMSATGRLMGQDLLQMINAGFNPLAEISRKTGKSIGDLKDEMEKGKISVQMVTDAFMSATSEGGQFHNMLEKQAEGLKGSFAYLRGAVADMMNDIGESLESVTVDAVNMGAEIVKNYREIGEYIVVLTGMYGAYRTAVMVTTAAEAAQASGTTLLAAAKANLVNVVQRLYASMTMNSYGLVLAAVVALGYGIYKLCTHQSDLEKASAKAAESSAKFESKMRDEQKTLDTLADRLAKSKKGTDEWKEAKDRIVAQFGQYNSGLDEEIRRTGNLASSYDSLARSIRMSAAARAMADYDSNSGLEEDMQKSLGKIREKLTGGTLHLVDKDGNLVRGKDYSRRDTNGYPVDKFTTVTVTGDLLEQIMGEVYDYIRNGDESVLSAKTRGYLQQQVGKGGWSELLKMRQRKADNDYGRNLIAQNYGTNSADVDMYVSGKEKSPASVSKVQNKKYWEERKKDAQSELDALTDIEAKGEAGRKLREKIRSIDKKLEAYSTKEKKTSGLTPGQINSKEENAEAKLADIIRKQGDERLRIDKDYEYTRWQNRIDLMDDGEAKVLAQMELNNSRELADLERHKQQEIEAELQRQIAVFAAKENAKAAGDKNYAKKVFRDSDIDQSGFERIEDRYAALEEDLTQSHIKAENDRLQASKDAYDEYLKEFGSYQQKREALQREYATRIEESQNDGERMTLTAQRDKALSDLDYEEWVDTGSIALAFGDISRLSDSTVTKLIEDMEKYREKVIATFDPQKIAEYEAALNSLRQIQSDESSGIFSTFVPDYFKERKSVATQKDSAADNVNALYEKRASIYNRILALQKQIEAARAKGEDTSELESELRDQQVALDANSTAAKKAVDSFKLLQEQWDRLDSPEEKFRGICDALSQVSDLAGGLTDSMSGMFADLGMDGAASAMGTVSDVVGSVGNVANGFANGGMIGGIAAAASEVFKWGGKLFGAKESDPHLLEDIERMTAVNEELTNAIDRLSAKMDKASLAEAGDIYEQQLEYLNASMANTQEMMARSGAAYGKHHSSNYRIDNSMSGADWQRISQIVGTTVRGAGDFWNLTSGQMALVAENAADLYAKIKQYADDGNNDAAQFMDDYISYYEQLNDLQEAYNEKITDTTFDSVRDSFKSTLLDMESDADSFAESFEDILRNAVVSSMMSDVFDKQIKEWYDAFSEAMREDGLSLDEKNTLRDRWDSIVGDAIRQRDELLETLGLDAASSTAQQKATYGGYETMSEDTATELNGRFTAIQDSNERIAQSVLATLTYLQNLTATVGGGNEILGNILLQHVRTNEYLDDIKRYTRELQTFGEKFDKIVENTNKL